MKKMKKTLTGLLCACLVFTQTGVSALANSPSLSGTGRENTAAFAAAGSSAAPSGAEQTGAVRLQKKLLAAAPAQEQNTGGFTVTGGGVHPE